jgi:hypothetical protein
MRALLVTFILATTPYAPADMAAWHNILNNRCPDHHIDDWMPERNQADLIDEFEMLLPSTDKEALAKASDHNKVCASAEYDNANSCEKSVRIHVLRRAHLLGRFTDYACGQFICLEPALCERLKTNR